MSDFSEGQRSIVELLVAKKVEEDWSTKQDAIKEICEKTIKEAESKRPSFWKFWKNPAGGATFLALAAAAFSYLDSYSSANLFVNNIVHEIAGTDTYLERQLRESENLKASVLAAVDEKLDIDRQDSELNVKMNSIMQSFVASFDGPEHPMPIAVQEIVSRKPILVFHGEGVFGRNQEVFAQFPDCQKIAEQIELTDSVTCDISVSIPEPDGFSIPFYATIQNQQLHRQHDVAVVIAVNRIQTEEVSQAPNLQPEEYLRDIDVSYVRNFSIAGQPDFIDLTEKFSHQIEGIFLANISETLREILVQPELAGAAPQSFLHALDLQVDQEALRLRSEILVVQVLIFVNRTPGEIQ